MGRGGTGGPEAAIQAVSHGVMLRTGYPQKAERKWTPVDNSLNLNEGVGEKSAPSRSDTGRLVFFLHRQIRNLSF